MPNPTYVQAEWERYREVVVPVGANEVQIFETKKAFFAGATTILSLLMSKSREDISDADGAQMLMDIEEEVRAFAEIVGLG